MSIPRQAGGQRETREEADRCLTPWNLAAKNLFQSFSMSGSLGSWVQVSFAQRLSAQQTWKVKPSVYFKFNYSFDCQSNIAPWDPTWNILITAFRDFLAHEKGEV